MACCRKIKTTDGAERTMGAGEVLFQDDVKKSPAKKTPRGHWSGTLPAQIATQQFKPPFETGAEASADRWDTGRPLASLRCLYADSYQRGAAHAHGFWLQSKQ